MVTKGPDMTKPKKIWVITLITREKVDDHVIGSEVCHLTFMRRPNQRDLMKAFSAHTNRKIRKDREFYHDEIAEMLMERISSSFNDLHDIHIRTTSIFGDDSGGVIRALQSPHSN